MAKRASLTDFTPPEPPPPEDADDKRRGQTLRLTPAAWRQLKLLALERGIASHALLIEAVNDLFQKHGRPPIA
jgi:hypothetical protein